MQNNTIREKQNLITIADTWWCEKKYMKMAWNPMNLYNSKQ